MNLLSLMKRSLERLWTFNSHYLGFLHESFGPTDSWLRNFSFQFPLLGISPWIHKYHSDSHPIMYLSIPITWDFSMNQLELYRRVVAPYDFQFPLLGISPWIIIDGPQQVNIHDSTFNSHYLGFLHESRQDPGGPPWTGPYLSIPITWDFSMNHYGGSLLSFLKEPFNSHYLGFLHESPPCWVWVHVTVCLSIPITWDFSMNQTLILKAECSKSSFNSHYLGFLHESPSWKNSAIASVYLSIPITWDFSMNLVTIPDRSAHAFSLSIPITWDFSMNHRTGTGLCPEGNINLSIPITWDFSMNPVGARF